MQRIDQRDFRNVSSRLSTCVLVSAIAAGYGSPSFAHHGAAAYDRGRTVSVEGTVEQFEWINPHGLIHLRTGDGDVWVAETAGLVLLVRAGWDRESLEAGEHCTLVGHPARNGSSTMIVERVVLADGRELGNFVP